MNAQKKRKNRKKRKAFVKSQFSLIAFFFRPQKHFQSIVTRLVFTTSGVLALLLFHFKPCNYKTAKRV